MSSNISHILFSFGTHSFLSSAEHGPALELYHIYRARACKYFLFNTPPFYSNHAAYLLTTYFLYHFYYPVQGTSVAPGRILTSLFGAWSQDVISGVLAPQISFYYISVYIVISYLIT